VDDEQAAPAGDVGAMPAGRDVRLGIVGAGFVARAYADALRHVRHQRVAVVASRGLDSARSLVSALGEGRAVSDVDEMLAGDEVDVVVVAVPQDAHLDVISAAARAGKAVIVTKPLARDAREAAACWDVVAAAGIWNAYAETSVFTPGVSRAKRLVDDGGIGRVLTVRTREAHARPHPHAMDAGRMGGGPLRGLGCHGVAVGRFFLEGARPVEAWAWGARLARKDTPAEDNALLVVRFDDGRMLQVEASWTHIPGLDVRREIHGDNGWIGIDEIGNTGVRAFAGSDAGYVAEKAATSTGWIAPVPDEAAAHGYLGEFEHFISSFGNGRLPRQTLRDGAIDAAVIDAGYRSMTSGRWEQVQLPT